MKKKLLASIMTTSILFSLVVIPASASGYSEANKTRYYNGIANGGGGNFEYIIEETKTLDGKADVAMNKSDGKYITKYKGVGNGNATLSNNRNPISYKTLAATRGTTPKYVHFRIYLGVYEDSGRTGLDDLYVMRHTKEDGSAVKAFSLKSTNQNDNTAGRAYPDGSGDLTIENYNTDFWSFRGSKDEQTYHKLDFIADCNGLRTNTCITYLFVDNRYVGSNYSTATGGFDNFYGYSFRLFKDKTINTNTTLEAYFEDGFEGHVEYNDTADYKVTLEDVLQDAGLGDDVSDSTIMYKTSNRDWYIPDATQNRELYYTSGSNSSRRVNGNVTYNGTETNIAVDNSDEFTLAADLLAFYPYSVDNARKTGISYTDYHPRAKFIKFSFDQTISESGMWLEYDSYYSDAVEAIKMWNNDGNLVVAVKGSGQNITLNGAGGKPVAEMTGTNHIDWVLEPDEDSDCVRQYLFVNNKLAASGNYGNGYACRINNIQLKTKSAAGQVKLDNWSMTLYNSDATLDQIRYNIEGVIPSKIKWASEAEELGYEFNDNGEIIVHVNPENIDGVVAGPDIKVITAIHDDNDNLLGIKIDPYTEEPTDDGITISNTFNYKTNMNTIKVLVWDCSQNAMIPLAGAITMPIEKTAQAEITRVLAIGNSFSQDCVSKLKEIAAADGVKMESYNAYLAGRNLKGHYDAWLSNGSKTYRIEPEGVNSDKYQSLQDFVTMRDWDYIMLQGTTHFPEYDAGLWNVNASDTSNYWTTLTNGIAELAPDAKRLVNATWAPINEFAGRVNDGMFAEGTPDARGAYLSALLPNEQIGADIYSTVEDTEGQKAYIPVAVAADYLIRRYGFPEHEGEKDDNNKYDNSASTRGVYRDTTCHLTDNVGRVLAGLVWYEMLTGNSAAENAYQRSTLSASDMTKIKDAAHYACQNYKTYDPATIEPLLEEEVSAEAMRVKNGADAVITIIHDDGSVSTANYLNREFEKNNLNGTVGIIGKNINTDSRVETWTNIINASNGRLNLASHSYNHRYMGESDDAESGTLSDGTAYDYPAGHMTQDIANERVRINGLFPNERVLTFIKPGTSYPEGKQQVSDAAMNMIKDHYIAMRNTGGNVDTIPPADYYSVKSLMAKPDQELQYWINLLSSATNKKGMLVYLFHEIIDADTASGNNVRQSDASAFFKELSRYVADGRVWNAKFDEAIQYMREYEAITGVTAINHIDSQTISVSVSDSISRIDTDITTGKYAGRDMYDYPVTIKVKLPYNWEHVKVTQAYDDRVEIVKPFTENGERYVYANVVPDVEAAVLSEVTASDCVSSISYNGTAIADFDPATKYYKVTLPAGSGTAPVLSCDQDSAVITQPVITDGEGSGFITYSGQKYEVHFIVNDEINKKVILVLVDGMRPDGFETCGNAYAAELKNNSLYTLNAKTVYPSVTLPCHLSLFYDVSPSVHGTTTNTYVPPTKETEGVFERLNTAKKKSCFYYNWEPLRDIARPKSITSSEFIRMDDFADPDSEIAERAIRGIKEISPDFAFIYLGDTDGIGHSYGWMGEKYLKGISDALDDIKKIIEATKDEYTLILTADHGGHAYTHGTDMDEDMTIPIFICGKGIEAGSLPDNSKILDIAPTIMDLIGVDKPTNWEGKSLLTIK